MKMLYTANGRYIRCCTEEGTRPVIIVCEKEYEVDVQEFMLWSILNWRILREEEISSFYEKMASSSNVTIPAVLNENLPLLFILLLWDFFHQIIYTAMQDTCQAQQGFPLRLVNVFLALLILLDGAHGDFCLSCQFRLAHFGQCAQAL